MLRVASNTKPLARRHVNSFSRYHLISSFSSTSGSIEPTPLPSNARVVIVGGGVIGASVAFHLSKHSGWEDILLLEQNAYTSGTTWHAAGLIGLTRRTNSETQLSIAGADLLQTLHEETGQDTGYKQCGSLTLARSKERMISLQRQLSTAKSFGIDGEILTPDECKEMYGDECTKLLHTEDLTGGLWWPRDGSASPTDLTMALLKGARNQGVDTRERVRVENFTSRRLHGQQRVNSVVTARGQEIFCDVVVLCGGQWSRQLASTAGISVPLHSAEHFYVITEEMKGVHSDLPVLRDLDALIYAREWGGGLCVGGFERNAKPAFTEAEGVPNDFEFGLFPDDWDQFFPLYEGAMHRIPQLENVAIRNMINGPESFTTDGHYLLGEVPEMKNFFVAAGFNSSGAGKVLSEWIVQGEPTQDLWPIDIRFHN